MCDILNTQDIERADILQVITAVRIEMHVLRVAKQGIWVGIGLSIIAMVVAAFGYLPPAAGAILQEGIDVLVIVNALRAGRLPLYGERRNVPLSQERK